MKKISYLTLSLVWLLAAPAMACTSSGQAQASASEQLDTDRGGKKKEATKDEVIKHIDAAFMRAHIFDYKENPTKFEFKGTRPAILDFYADWCPPCRRLSPKLIKLAEKYQGQVDVYKINVDDEAELARVFGVKSIPMLLFIPLEGTPIQTLGDLSEDELEQSVSKILAK